MSNIDELKKNLQLQEALHRIYQSEDFQTHVVPLLQKAISNDNWINPQEEDFLNKYTYSFALTQAYKEIIKIFSNAGQSALQLKNAIDKPEKSYGIK